MSVIDSLTRQAAKRVVLRVAGSLKEGHLTARFPNGRVRTFGTPGALPKADIAIHSDEFYPRALFHGEIGIGEAYMDGLWTSSDVASVIELGLANRGRVQLDASWLTRASRAKNLAFHRKNANTKEKAKQNIHAHYDLGNDFFRLFLDETLTYSCAYFASPGQSLADAQRNKYRVLCEKAGIRRGDHVLEIGSGWGGFAMYAAGQYGCHVTSLTISEEQFALARQRVEEAGLSSLVDIRFCDYRDIQGEFDAVVSIEMFEAVGAEYFATYFETVNRVLKPGGRMALQTISTADRNFATMRDGVNWIQKYIFPGGMLPSIAEIERALKDTRLVITDLEDIGPHYVWTLREWRERFMAALPQVRAQGFDERFIRMWEFYLGLCEAGFAMRNTGDLQIVLTKPQHRAVPFAARTVTPAEATPSPASVAPSAGVSSSDLRST